MELIIHILMLFIVINCSFKLSFWKLWQTVIYSLIAGLFVAGTWQYAILQSKTQIADYLQNTEALQNMAIIITLESALCFGYCVAFLRGLYGKKNLWWAGLITSLVSQLVALPRIILLSHRSYLPVTWRRLFSDSLVTCRDSGYRHPIIKPADEVSCTRRRSPVGSSFPCQLIHLYPRTTDHCQWENDLCCHRGGTQLESDYLVHRSVRCPVSHWICLEQAEMAFITT